MFSRLLIVTALVGIVAVASRKSTAKTPIEHVIVLMLENRSLDHMLGFLKKTIPDFNGCLPNEVGCSNPSNPADPNSPIFTVTDSAVYEQTDPDHSTASTTQQIYPASSTVPTMQGFIAEYAKRTDASADIMSCFSPEHLPVMYNLTQEFAIFDGWHAGMPGPTQPNRAYAISTTSHGMATNNNTALALGQPQKTIFRQIEEMGLEYRVYFESVPGTLLFKDMRHRDARPNYHNLKKFYEDLKTGDLPEYSWVEPNYFNVDAWPASDQHPDHDVSIGDALIKDVYEALRASPAWEKSALIILYDEHGGFFDHVPPPTGVPNPDGMNATDSPFDFTRLGVRVPSLIISPWVAKGKIIHAMPVGEGQYEHSSIAATVVHKLFAPVPGRPQQPYLTKRDAWAATFESLFTELPSPRTDCPMEAPAAPSHRILFPSSFSNKKLDGSGKLNDLQQEWVTIVAGATDDYGFDRKNLAKWTEHEAMVYNQKRLNDFFGRDIVQMV